MGFGAAIGSKIQDALVPRLAKRIVKTDDAAAIQSMSEQLTSLGRDMLELKGQVPKAITDPAARAKLSTSVMHKLAHLENPVHYEGISYEAQRTLKAQLKPGDILLSRSEAPVGLNGMVPGFWTHAAIVTSPNHVTEATLGGVMKDRVDGALGEDNLIVLRPKNLNEEQLNKAVAYANEQIGKPYDSAFDFKHDDKFSCTELVANAINAGAGSKVIDTNWMGTITPDRIRKNPNFQVVHLHTVAGQAG